MNRNERDRFQLVNLENRSDVLERLRSAERELSDLVDGEVALVAWVKRAETD